MPYQAPVYGYKWHFLLCFRNKVPFVPRVKISHIVSPHRDISQLNWIQQTHLEFHENMEIGTSSSTQLCEMHSVGRPLGHFICALFSFIIISKTK